MSNAATGSFDAKVIQDLLKPIIDSVNTLSEGQKGLALEIQGIKSTRTGDDDDDKNKNKKHSDRDLESMSRTEFLDVIMDGVGKMLDEKVKPVAERIEKKTEKDLEEEVNKAVSQAQKDHKDFWEWKDEMGKELTKNPYLMPEDAYQLARLHNATKAKEMDVKFPSEEEVKKQKEEEAAKEHPGFGGLTPTSGKTVPSDTMNFDDASEAAWQKVAGHLEK